MNGYWGVKLKLDISIDLEFSAKDNWYITKELTYRVGIGFCLYKNSWF